MRVGAIEVRKHQDAEELRASGLTEGIETLAKISFELLEVHGVDGSARFPVDLARG